VGAALTRELANMRYPRAKTRALCQPPPPTRGAAPRRQPAARRAAKARR
jgi:hypothetical protein